VSETTSIGWTDATFNPWWGCVEVSRECDNCYARVWAKRTGDAVWGKHSPRKPASESYWQKPFTTYKREAEKLGRPLRVFCASMADVFETHPQLPPLRERLWDVIERTPWIDWQLLTKRPRSVQLMVPWGDDWPPNVWIGTSIGAPEHTWRADVLRQIPAAVRFISAEPLLDSLYVGKRPLSLDGIHWLIVGGESGGKARPFHLEHARELIGDALAVGDLHWPLAENATKYRPAVFVKQLGARPVVTQHSLFTEHKMPIGPLRDGKGEDWDEWPADLRIREFPASRPREGEAMAHLKEKAKSGA
jgi:protein gp37